MSFAEKLSSILVSRRFWVSVLVVAVSIGALLGYDPLANIDPDAGADQVMPFMEALKIIIMSIVPILTGLGLINSYTARAAGKDDK